MRKDLVIASVAIAVLLLGALLYFKQEQPVTEQGSAREVRTFEERAPHTCDENFLFFITGKGTQQGHVTCTPFKKPDAGIVAPGSEYMITCDTTYEVTFELDEDGNPAADSCSGKER